MQFVQVNNSQSEISQDHMNSRILDELLFGELSANRVHHWGASGLVRGEAGDIYISRRQPASKDPMGKYWIGKFPRALASEYLLLLLSISMQVCCFHFFSHWQLLCCEQLWGDKSALMQSWKYPILMGIFTWGVL